MSVHRIRGYIYLYVGYPVVKFKFNEQGKSLGMTR
jgi:hypothetical protein